MKPLLILCSVLLLHVAVRGQDLYPLRLFPFLEKYLEQPGYVYPMKGGRYSFIDLRPWTDDFKTGGQQLIRTDSNLYIFVQNTSRVYKAVKRDSLFIQFQRIDNTLGIFYNIGSYQFSDGEDLYSYGGYGFWKSNGLLRKFNFKQGEWDVVPLNREVIAQVHPGPLIWFDPVRRKLHVPFQQVVNDGVTQIKHDVGEIDEASWELDLETRTWERTGTAHPSILRIAEKANNVVNYPFSDGLMLESIGQMVWIDYRHNRLIQSGNNPVVQLMNRNPSLFDLTFIKNNTQFYYNTQNQKSDSLDLRQLTPMEVSVVIESDSRLPWAAGGFIVSALAAGMFIRKRRKGKKLTESAHIVAGKSVAEKSVIPSVVHQPEIGGNHAIDEIYVEEADGVEEIGSEIVGVETDSTVFTATEKDLILLCLERSEAGGHADIDEINHVLGIKNKNKGLQKKVRSEVFNSVNNKFREYTKGNIGLIESVRNKNDKRYFDYFIESRNFFAIRALLRLS